MLQNQCAASASTDSGPNPFVANIALAARENTAFRAAFWTGEHLQMTLMSIPVRGEIGFEMHADVDQFIRIEQGRGIVIFGNGGAAPAATATETAGAPAPVIVFHGASAFTTTTPTLRAKIVTGKNLS